MAYVQVVTGATRPDGKPSYTGVKVTHQQAIDILAVLNNEREPESDKQRNFCNKVHKVFFSLRSADPSWIADNLNEIMPFVLAEWAVDGDGIPTRPDNGHSWEFAKRFQLFANKRPASMALFHINKIKMQKQGYK